MWITTKAYELPLFYASIKLLCDSTPSPSSLHTVFRALWSSPDLFPIPMLSLRWLYLWSKLAEPWPSPKRARFVDVILASSADGTTPTTTGAGLQLAHLAVTGILSHLPPKSYPPARVTQLIHSVAAKPAINTPAFTYALLFLSAPRQQLAPAWPPISAHLASHVAPHLTETLCADILPTLVPTPGMPRDPLSQMWLPLIGPLGHLLGASLRLSPSAPQLLQRIVAAYKAIHPLMHSDAAPQSLLFLAVMLVQDMLLSPLNAPTTELLPLLASLLALVHPITLKLTQYVPGAPPFPSYADVVADLTAAAVQSAAVDRVCDTVLATHSSDALVAFLATWLVSDPRALLPLAPAWVLDTIATVAGRHAPPTTSSATPPEPEVEIQRVAWEAAHWLVVQVLESDAPGLQPVRAGWWVWYADVWWPAGAADDHADATTAHQQVDGIVHEIRWRATSALAGAASNHEQCMWLVERVGRDVVALAVLVNGVPRQDVGEVMRRVELEVDRTGLSKEQAVAVVEQWDRVGGLRWDRAVEVARWWNRIVDHAGLMV
ncbi:hypothetical protein BCR44DRAFT_1280241 [Catenaria anguillulae PL171]|uniref:Uncharacterized protein n=1 Tax=Catenaria anguillulae PL171 TaxID=765915 RepID=A0A1Y2H923_9FUNG|nr:hypothetical protein BCR44DRAFT_1280241 [Catenaria anguillulae PL171]